MELLLLGTAGCALVITLLLLGMPVAFVMFSVGLIGHWVVVGPQAAFAAIPVVFYDKLSMYSLTVLPLFVLMGMFAWKAGFADDAFQAARQWVNRIPGGLAQATILAGTAFAAACGTTIASCAALSKICIPAMRGAGIDLKLAIGVVASSAALSVMIPPSVIMPLYAIITEQSVGKLLIAGIIPGFIAAAVFMVVVAVMVKMKPGLAPG